MCVQEPDTQLSALHPLLSSQLAQLPPPVPQAEVLFPVTQVEPFQHP